MCLAFPGKIIKIIDNQHALVDFDGLKKVTNIALVEDARIGDYVTVHAGFAIQKMGKGDAWEVLKLYEQNKLKGGKTSRENK